MLGKKSRRGARRRRTLQASIEALEPRLVLDSTVVFNEIMYNPAQSDESLEWVELHNQNSVDVDISAWRIDDGINFDFPEGTIVPGGGYLVVAKDPAALAAAGDGDDSDDFWFELFNLSGETVDLDGFVVKTSAGDQYTLSDVSIAPGAFVVLSEARIGFDVLPGRASISTTRTSRGC